MTLVVPRTGGVRRAHLSEQSAKERRRLPRSGQPGQVLRVQLDQAGPVWRLLDVDGIRDGLYQVDSAARMSATAISNTIWNLESRSVVSQRPIGTRPRTSTAPARKTIHSGVGSNHLTLRPAWHRPRSERRRAAAAPAQEHRRCQCAADRYRHPARYGGGGISLDADRCLGLQGRLFAPAANGHPGAGRVDQRFEQRRRRQRWLRP